MSKQNFSNLLSVFFRISDGPTPEKWCQKEVCFINFLSVFNGYPITVVADNVNEKMLTFVKQPGVNVIQTSLGNSGSFLKTLELATQANTMFAYFAEDDYIHRPDAPRLIVEGLRWSNYVTLYDHPDKYLKERGYGEVGRCLKTETWHWRQTISTTNTFGANVALLGQDMDTFRRHSTGPVPADHAQWCELAQKKRTLTVAIPGAAFNTHRVCEHSGFDWGAIWAGEQIKNVGEILARSGYNVFQQPPEDVTFAPCELPAPAKPNGLPDLAAMGKTTQLPAAPKVVPVEPSKVRKAVTRPALAIPDPVAMHHDNKTKKKFEVEDSNFGAFVPTG